MTSEQDKENPPPYRRKEVIGDATLYLGDCRVIMPHLAGVDAVITDPPYGDTSLDWDSRVLAWLSMTRQVLNNSGSLWVFGSMRFFMDTAMDFQSAGFRYAQDNVWEKHNGSSFHADRFKRVHEHAVQFYPKEVPWADIYKSPVTTPDAVAKTVRRKKRPPHTGNINASSYESEDGGPRLMRSVQFVRSCHGYAVHPTQKPTDIVDPLVRYSCPVGGAVLDPFMGSGTTGVVCARRGLYFTGVEIDEGYFEKACERIRQAYADPIQPELSLCPEITQQQIALL
jgi:site-specific DNA-methyltransferase (adenine-specific)